MNNDVEAAVEKLREAFEFDCKRCGNDTAESLWRDELLILAHIDGEPARIAAACEEVREACAERVPSIGQPHDCFKAVRATPLTATPLADALVRAEEGVRYWTDLAQAEARDAAALRARVAELEREARRCDGYAILRRELDGVTFCRKEGARVVGEILAERDALRAQAEALERERDMLQTALRDNSAAHSETGKALLRAEAQVEAARKVCELRIKTQWRVPDVYITAHDVLRAMDGAKP